MDGITSRGTVSKSYYMMVQKYYVDIYGCQIYAPPLQNFTHVWWRLKKYNIVTTTVETEHVIVQAGRWYFHLEIYFDYLQTYMWYIYSSLRLSLLNCVPRYKISLFSAMAVCLFTDQISVLMSFSCLSISDIQRDPTRYGFWFHGQVKNLYRFPGHSYAVWSMSSTRFRPGLWGRKKCQLSDRYNPFWKEGFQLWRKLFMLPRPKQTLNSRDPSLKPCFSASVHVGIEAP